MSALTIRQVIQQAAQNALHGQTPRLRTASIDSTSTIENDPPTHPCQLTYTLYWQCAHAYKKIDHSDRCKLTPFPVTVSVIQHRDIVYPDYTIHNNGHNNHCDIFHINVQHSEYLCEICSQDPNAIPQLRGPRLNGDLEADGEGKGVEVFSQSDKVHIRLGWERVQPRSREMVTRTRAQDLIVEQVEGSRLLRRV